MSNIWTEKEKNILKDLYMSDKTNKEIALKLNKTEFSIKNSIYRFGLNKIYKRNLKENLVGKTFGNLTVIKEAQSRIQPNGKSVTMWECKCSCGSDKISYVNTWALKSGRIKSCGGSIHKSGENNPRKKYNEYEVFNSIAFVKFSNCNEYFLCDLDDWNKLKQYCWYKDGEYSATEIDGKKTLMHRLITNCDENMVVDHILQASSGLLDNRKSNLRTCFQEENVRNSIIAKNNKSGVTGVHFSDKKNKWIASIGYRSKTYFLDGYKNFEEAVKARLKAEKKYFGKFAPQKHLFKEYGI